MIMPTKHVSREKLWCGCCGKYIIKKQTESWTSYNKRKYCGQRCFSESRKGGNTRMDPNSTDQSDVSDYIGMKSKNGRLMADFNLGVLNAVEKVSDDRKLDIAAGGKINTVICTYKGVQVTGEVVKSANQWLMDNWKGRPGQRSDTVKEPELSRDEIDRQILAMEAE